MITAYCLKGSQDIDHKAQLPLDQNMHAQT